MKVAFLCQPDVATSRADAALASTASALCERHVGAVVVVDAVRRPVGILTDRDIVRGQLRLSADLHCLAVADVMTGDPLVIEEDTDLPDAISAMNTRQVRRAPVVDRNGRLVGIVALDDLLPAVANELGSLVTLMSMQSYSEEQRHPAVSSTSRLGSDS